MLNAILNQFSEICKANVYKWHYVFNGIFINIELNWAKGKLVINIGGKTSHKNKYKMTEASCQSTNLISICKILCPGLIKNHNEIICGWISALDDMGQKFWGIYWTYKLYLEIRMEEIIFNITMNINFRKAHVIHD